MLNSQRHVRDLIFATVADAQASGRTFEICYVQSTLTGYEYLDNAPGLIVNGTSILSTINGGETRWRSIYGKYEFNKFAVPVTASATETVFKAHELPELVFDINGDVVMQLVDGGTI